jgi:hypothetical protein
LNALYASQIDLSGFPWLSVVLRVRILASLRWLGLTNYRFRAILTGISRTAGLGSPRVFTDPSAVGLAGQAALTKCRPART